MSNVVRTDAHSPLNLVTEDYAFAGCIDFDLNDPKARKAQDEMIARVLDGRAWANVHGRTQCDHCGAHFRYAAMMIHTPSNTVLTVGETCLDNRFDLATSQFHAMRKAAELDRAAQKIRKAVDAFVAANPDLACLGRGAELPETSSRNSFLIDLSRKLNHYGSLSERQVEAARKSLARDIEWAAQRAAKVAAEPVATPVLTGRIEITGEILTTKYVENDFGGTLKMMVRDDRGFRVWGSVPSSLDASRGDRVTFTATVEASKDDPTFGFASRPSKARSL
jgi:hypothetical protein